MPYFIGVDGGGSQLRVVVVDAALNVLGQAHGDTANPNVAGPDLATQRIHSAIHSALDTANLTPDDITAIGLGVAGASIAHSEGWLRGVAESILPQARIVPSSDVEIALVGAHGRRFGVLVLAGTGSVAYGVNADGDSIQVGGWGYLLGDEGSGYWLGLQALRHIIQAADGRSPATALRDPVLDAVGVPNEKALIAWTYHAPQPRTRAIAQLAPLVLAAARSGDPAALSIVEEAAHELARHVHAVLTHLGDPSLPVAFAGGLLAEPNPVSERLCARLGLDELPTAHYSPVMGAALLARDTPSEH